MDVTMTIKTGGGRKQNSVSHSVTLKEAQTWEETEEFFRGQMKAFFPTYQTLDKPQGKKKKEE